MVCFLFWKADITVSETKKGNGNKKLPIMVGLRRVIAVIVHIVTCRYQSLTEAL